MSRDFSGASSHLTNATFHQSADGHDHLTLRLRALTNYGPLYGVYMATGVRREAAYVARHQCLSGNNDQMAILNPLRFTAALYVCTD
jgi:hypothetical protein